MKNIEYRTGKVNHLKHFSELIIYVLRDVSNV